jgi:hypothetical protein
MISHDDPDTIEKGLDIIHSFFKNIENLDVKLSDFIVSMYTEILGITIQGNQRLQEIACSLKDIIYHLFEHNINSLITPCKNQLVKFLLQEFSKGDTLLSDYLLHEIGIILKSSNEVCPFTVEDIKSVWDTISNDVNKMENSLEPLLEIGVYYPDYFAHLICNTIAQLKQSDEECMAYFIELMGLLSKEKRICFKEYQSIDMCIGCMKKLLVFNLPTHVRACIYEPISEFVKTLGIDIGFAINIIKEYGNNENIEDAKGCAQLLWCILLSWPIESILDYVQSINEVLACLQKKEDNALKELCAKCVEIMQKNDMNK